MSNILLVEDDPTSRELMKIVLQRAGHEVREAEDGEAALAALEQGNRPDVVILDLMMPRVGGVDVLRRLRQDHRWQNLPVMLMTALDQDPQVDAARTLGFQRHFLKSYWHMGDLLKEVGRAGTASN